MSKLDSFDRHKLLKIVSVLDGITILNFNDIRVELDGNGSAFHIVIYGGRVGTIHRIYFEDRPNDALFANDDHNIIDFSGLVVDARDSSPGNLSSRVEEKIKHHVFFSYYRHYERLYPHSIEIDTGDKFMKLSDTISESKHGQLTMGIYGGRDVLLMPTEDIRFKPMYVPGKIVGSIKDIPTPPTNLKLPLVVTIEIRTSRGIHQHDVFLGSSRIYKNEMIMKVFSELNMMYLVLVALEKV